MLPQTNPQYDHLGRFLSIIDTNGNWVGVTKSLAVLLGFQDEHDLTGLHAPDFYEITPERMRFQQRMIEETGAVTDVAVLITRTGERVRYAFTTRKVNGGDLYATVGEPLPDDPPAPAAPADPWLSRKEAAAYCATTTRTIDRAVHTGELRSRKNGTARMFRRSWLDDWRNGEGRTA